MKKPHILHAITLALCLFLLNCKEKEDVIPKTKPSPAPTYSLDDIFDELQLKYKTVTIDANRDTSFYGNSGTRYILNANSLMTMDGTPVTGNVQVEVCEYLDKGDMIFSRMLPVSDGEPLMSGGEVDIKASQSGQPLRLRDGDEFRANVPQRGKPSQFMEFYRGETKVDGGQNLVNWKRPVVDTTGQLNNYYSKVAVLGTDTISIFSDSLALSNIDRLLSPQWRNVNIIVTVSGATIDGNAVIYTYALVKDENFNALMHTGMQLESYYSRQLPSVPVHLVAFTVMDGKFYAGSHTVTPVTGTTYTFNLVSADPAAFKKQLNDL